VIARPGGLRPRSSGTGRRGSAIEPFVQLADPTGIVGLSSGLAAVGRVCDAVGAVALVLALVSDQLAVDRVATGAWDAPAEARLAPRPHIGSAWRSDLRSVKEGGYPYCRSGSRLA